MISDAANSVTAYDEEGNTEELAHMRTGREDHGCGVVNLGSEKVKGSYPILQSEYPPPEFLLNSSAVLSQNYISTTHIT